MCLNFIAHTARMKLAMPADHINTNIVAGGVNRSPLIAQPTVGTTNPKHPITNRIQTVIEARALNIVGISPSFLVLYF